MTKSILTFSAFSICIASLCLATSCFAQTARSVIIASTRSMYNAEMRAVKKALKHKVVSSKLEKLETFNPRRKTENRALESNQVGPISLSDLPLPRQKAAALPEGNLISSQTEHSKSGWETF